MSILEIPLSFLPFQPSSQYSNHLEEGWQHPHCCGHCRQSYGALAALGEPLSVCLSVCLCVCVCVCGLPCSVVNLDFPLAGALTEMTLYSSNLLLSLFYLYTYTYTYHMYTTHIHACMHMHTHTNILPIGPNVAQPGVRSLCLLHRPPQQRQLQRCRICQVTGAAYISIHVHVHIGWKGVGGETTQYVLRSTDILSHLAPASLFNLCLYTCLFRWSG